MEKELLKEKIIKILEINPYRIILSKPSDKNAQYRKLVIEQVKNNLFQIAKYTDKQVFHENVKTEELSERLFDFLKADYLQLNAWSETKEASLLVSKKGKITDTLRNIKASESKPVHIVSKKENAQNRQKNYIIPEGQIVAPLVDMGIFTKEGKVVNSMYDKYRQINRFIEIIDDAVRAENLTHLNIIDFGCGKSYLTFIVYYYLTEVRKITVDMIGLDLKADVIKKCNEAAMKYGYNGLRFEMGDINGFNCPFDVDMVLTLHACDTATDYALFNAVSWNAKMIFSVPCCQHEINKQIKSDDFSILTRYGIIKERFSALVTDSVRANLLEYRGYNTQLLEFVDFEHTPKNILIRAVKNPSKPDKTKEKALYEVERLMQEFHLEPTLYRLFCK